MRIKLNDLTIIEAQKVYITPGGQRDKNNPGKYKDMICAFTIVYGNDRELEGRFKCDGAATFEECSKASYKLMDELYKNGCIDVSTDEKCEEYGMIFYWYNILKFQITKKDSFGNLRM